MKKAGIVIDSWKQPIFARHLTQAGYSFKVGPGVTPDTRALSVETENLQALEVVVRAANGEAAGVGRMQ